MSLIKRDRKSIWHPFTQEKTAGNPIAIKSGNGAYVIDENGKKHLDLISSWWVNLHGHCNEEIAEKISKQARTLEHVLFGGFTHEPAIELCEKLSNILPNELEKFFFSDNGSTSTEVALKTSHQYWHNKNQKNRNLFLSLKGAYHGDTFGAMSVSKTSEFHQPFLNLMFEIISIDTPVTFIGDNNIEIKEDKSLMNLQTELDKNGHNISALIVEPLVQGASGMRMYRPEFLNKLIKLIRKYDILVIFDEVMTGFGRTGTYFACNQITEKPDIICISKGITGGFLPLALTVSTKKIYDAFYSDDWHKSFTHGHSYTANPIACAAAIASYDILVRDETQESIKKLNKIHVRKISLLKNYPDKIKNLRITGTIAAFDLINHMHVKPMVDFFTNEGLLLRPLGNSIYLIPPYNITEEELISAYEKIEIGIKSLQ